MSFLASTIRSTTTSIQRTATTSNLLRTMSSTAASFPGKIATKQGPGHAREEQAQLHLLTLSTPNGKKVQIALEELNKLYGTKFSWDFVNISEGIQKEKWFLAHCPNGRIPALIDNSRKSLDGTDAPFSVFETGAILLYLAKFYDTDDAFGFKDPLERNECLQWIFFQHGGVGPMQGQLNHFNKYAPEKIPYAIKRYLDETKRLYSVLEGRLSGEFTGSGERDWLAGKGKGKYSWAEMATYPWVAIWEMSGLTSNDMEAFPNLRKWMERVEAREAVQKGMKGYDKPEEK